MKQLEPAEVLRIIEHADPEKLCLVGGQALNLWAEHYSHAPELIEYAPYTSKDVDFFGRYQAAKKLAEALGGYVEEPSSDGIQSWVEAIVVVPQSDNEDLRIDVLSHLLGTKDKDVSESWVKLHLPIRQSGAIVGRLPISIMHPFHVLQSRIANVIDIDSRNAKQVTTRQRQAKAAPIVLREYLRDVLSRDELDEVRGTLRQLGKWLRKDQYGQQARRFVDYDPKLILEEHISSVQLDQRWIDGTLRPLVDDIERYRARMDKP